MLPSVGGPLLCSHRPKSFGKDICIASNYLWGKPPPWRWPWWVQAGDVWSLAPSATPWETTLHELVDADKTMQFHWDVDMATIPQQALTHGMMLEPRYAKSIIYIRTKIFRKLLQHFLPRARWDVQQTCKEEHLEQISTKLQSMTTKRNEKRVCQFRCKELLVTSATSSPTCLRLSQ